MGGCGYGGTLPLTSHDRRGLYYLGRNRVLGYGIDPELRLCCAEADDAAND